MKLFNSTADRELWIRLNAERQIEWEKSLTYWDETGTQKPTLQALNPRTMEEALEVSANQLAFDEREGRLRYTLAELLTLDQNGLEEIRIAQHREIFKNFKDKK